MNLGFVSNCLQTQLREGQRLTNLIERAVEGGWTSIELRQTCLGELESEDHVPDPDALHRLRQRVPNVDLNVAIACPFFSPSKTDASLVSKAQLAASAVAGADGPHLRLVDLATPPAEASTHQAESVEWLLKLAEEMSDRGGKLSIENAAQPWSAVRAVFENVRNGLSSDRSLQLCFDPCNLLMAPDERDPIATTASLRADEIALFHYKQRRDGGVVTDLDEGDLDWPRVEQALRSTGFIGPRLLEIRPSSEAWDTLEAARRRVNELGG